MRETWRSEEEGVKVKCFVAPDPPKQFRTHQHFFLSGGFVSPSFPLAALLRAIYSVLLVPSADVFRELVISQLREPVVQVRLIGLVERCGSYVDCNVAAKLLRVMCIVLRSDPHQSVVEDRPHLVGCYSFANFACSCLRSLLGLLAPLGTGYILTVQQQVLCKEAIRLLKQLVTTAARMDLSGVPSAIRAECVEMGYERMLDPLTVQAVFLSMVYDMQADLGSQHGQYISERFVRSVLGRRELHSLVSEVLAAVIWGCPRRRYEVLGLFNRYAVLGRHKFTASYLPDLVGRVDVLRLQSALQDLLRERTGDQSEHILQCAYVELPVEQQGWRLSLRAPGTGPRMFVVTNKRLLILARGRHGHLSKPCGICPQESFCPVAPEIEREMDLKDLTRIVVGADSQLFILAWKKYSRQNEICGEHYDYVICHRCDVRNALLDALSWLSGPSSESRVEPICDTLVADTVHRRMAARLLCVSFAMRVLTNGEERLSLFVLSEAELCEFEVRFEHWLVPHEIINHFDDAGDPGEVDIIDGDGHHLAGERRRRRPNEFSVRKERTEGELLLGSSVASHGQADLPQLTDGHSDRGHRQRHRPSRTLWDHVDHDELLQVLEDRDRAMRNTDAWILDQDDAHHVAALGPVCLGFRLHGGHHPGSGGGAAGGGGGEARDNDAVRARVMNERRKLIFQLLAKEPVWRLKRIEFLGGDKPSLRIAFKKKGSETLSTMVDIRFFDDAARESWRRGLALALHKGSAVGQWQRDWDGS